MRKALDPERGALLHFGWMLIARFVLYLTIALYFLQSDYLGADERIYRPHLAILYLGLVFVFNLVIVLACRSNKRREYGLIFSFAVDILMITRIVLVSGGFSSMFLPYYIPVLILAPAWLPRRHSAIFPSIAVLGVAYIGLAHFQASMTTIDLLSPLYPEQAVHLLRHMDPPGIVAAMLVLTVLFFVVSYFAGMLGHRYFLLRQRMETAERNVEHFAAISTMAAGLAHEIRNPLASLRSAIQEIGDSFPEESQNRLLAGVIISESDRLDKVIERFLDFSREGQLHPSRQKLGQILRDVRTLLLHNQKAEGLEFNIVIRNDPEVLCDVDRLKEVFFNLALNAAQMTPAGKGRLTVSLSSAKRNGVPGVEILFADNGPGFEEHVTKRLFQPFFTTRPEGSGMGLSLSRKQVRLHGGEIDAGNNPEGGAWFRVWVPLSPPIRV